MARYSAWRDCLPNRLSNKLRTLSLARRRYAIQHTQRLFVQLDQERLHMFRIYFDHIEN